MLIAILASHAPSPGSQTVRHTGATLMKGGAWRRMGGEFKKKKTEKFSCHGERGHYDQFRPKTLRVECGRGRGAKVQLPGEGPVCLDWSNRSFLEFNEKLSAS